MFWGAGPLGCCLRYYMWTDKPRQEACSLSRVVVGDLITASCVPRAEDHTSSLPLLRECSQINIYPLFQSIVTSLLTPTIGVENSTFTIPPSQRRLRIKLKWIERNNSGFIWNGRSLHICQPGLEMAQCTRVGSQVFTSSIRVIHQAWLWAHVSYGTVTERKHVSIRDLQPEFYVVVSHPIWVLGPKCRSSVRAASALNCWPVSPALFLVALNVFSSMKEKICNMQTWVSNGLCSLRASGNTSAAGGSCNKLLC